MCFDRKTCKGNRKWIKSRSSLPPERLKYQNQSPRSCGESADAGRSVHPILVEAPISQLASAVKCSSWILELVMFWNSTNCLGLAYMKRFHWTSENFLSRVEILFKCFYWERVARKLRCTKEVYLLLFTYPPLYNIPMGARTSIPKLPWRQQQRKEGNARLHSLLQWTSMKRVQHCIPLQLYNSIHALEDRVGSTYAWSIFLILCLCMTCLHKNQ